MNPGSVQFAAQSFGKAGHVSLGRRVNREIRDRKKAGRGTDIQNRAAFLFDHGRQQSACQPRQRHHVDLHHLVNPLRIGGRKCAHVSKSGVVDQQIDRGLLRLPPRQSIRRPARAATDRLAGFRPQSRMPPEQFRAQFLQPLFAPGDEHERRGASAELARELASDARRSAGDQSACNLRVASRSCVLREPARARARHFPPASYGRPRSDEYDPLDSNQSWPPTPSSRKGISAALFARARSAKTWRKAAP